jgi:hypothetical protein
LTFRGAASAAPFHLDDFGLRLYAENDAFQHRQVFPHPAPQDAIIDPAILVAQQIADGGDVLRIEPRPPLPRYPSSAPRNVVQTKTNPTLHLSPMPNREWSQTWLAWFLLIRIS